MAPTRCGSECAPCVLRTTEVLEERADISLALAWSPVRVIGSAVSWCLFHAFAGAWLTTLHEGVLVCTCKARLRGAGARLNYSTSLCENRFCSLDSRSNVPRGWERLEALPAYGV